MMFLLDTNVISEIRKGRRCDAEVANWFAGVAEEELYLSALVLGEIRRGAELARHRGDRQQADTLGYWLQAINQRFSERILPIDDAVADRWGRLSSRRPIPIIDGLLAATALVHDFTLVTRNTSDVQGLDVKLLNPFAAT